jgi:hypothetical protein
MIDNGSKGALWDDQDEDQRMNEKTGVVNPSFLLVHRDQYCLTLPAASRSPAGLYPASRRFLM